MQFRVKGNFACGDLVMKDVPRGRRKKRPFSLPPELQGLSPRIKENGEVDLGICREVLLRFLESLREADKTDKLIHRTNTDPENP